MAAQTKTPKHLHTLHKQEADYPDGKPGRHETKGPHIKKPKLMHPLHAHNTDHHDLGSKEKVLKDGPHISMPDHQHPLHSPHVHVDGHKSTHLNPRKYK